MVQAARVASHHNPTLKRFADRLRAAGKPHKVVITAVARKRVTIVNARIKSDHEWSVQAVKKIQLLSVWSCPRAVLIL